MAPVTITAEKIEAEALEAAHRIVGGNQRSLTGYYEEDDPLRVARACLALLSEREALVEERDRLIDLVGALSDALTDEGPDWSDLGLAILRQRVARALPDMEWLQPYAKGGGQ